MFVYHETNTDSTFAIIKGEDIHFSPLQMMAKKAIYGAYKSLQWQHMEEEKNNRNVGSLLLFNLM